MAPTGTVGPASVAATGLEYVHVVLILRGTGTTSDRPGQSEGNLDSRGIATRISSGG